MTTYTYSEARQKLASVLDEAKSDGEVLIRRKDGSLFTIKPVLTDKSPLDVEGVDIEMASDEIVSIIREIRNR